MTIRDASPSPGWLPFVACALLATGCSTPPSPAAQTARMAAPPAAHAAPEPPAPPAFVEAACGGCHAVEPPFLSPNPRAPSFEAIANRAGLTNETLSEWLADAHNYPEMMDFDLQPDQVQQVADYMVTLRREDYVPAQ